MTVTMYFQMYILLVVTISLSLQSPQGEGSMNSTFNEEWGRQWCSYGYYYDDGCKRCSACHPRFRPNPDGPILQCQVDSDGRNNHLCAASSITLLSFLEDKRALPVSFLISLIITMIVCLTAFKCIYEPNYWWKKVKKLTTEDGKLSMDHISLLYLEITGKTKELSKLLDIGIPPNLQHTAKEYSEEEFAYRYLFHLTDSNKGNNRKIARAFCTMGKGQMAYRFFSGLTDNQNSGYYQDLERGQRSDRDLQIHDQLSVESQTNDLSDDILDVCDKLYERNYMRNQFVIAILLELKLGEIDACRYSNCSPGSIDAMHNIFAKWLHTNSSNYNFTNLNLVLQKAGIDIVLSCPT